MSVQVTGKTKLLGLLGWPVSHTKSPLMHNAAIAKLGKSADYVYLPLPVRPEALETAVRALPELGFRGVNLTLPHKQAIIPLLDSLDKASQVLGAVNTIVINNDGDTPRLDGYNTDWLGFLTDLQAMGVDVADQDCLVLGAGGSARAVAYALASAGGRVHVLARRVEQAKKLVNDLSQHFDEPQFNYHDIADLRRLVPHFRDPIIVNTTPLGMTPHTDKSPWPSDLAIPVNAFIYDLVYTPSTTKLMQQGADFGCNVSNGLGMLVWQGAIALRLWTGLEPDVAVMAAAIQ